MFRKEISCTRIHFLAFVIIMEMLRNNRTTKIYCSRCHQLAGNFFNYCNEIKFKIFFCLAQFIVYQCNICYQLSITVPIINYKNFKIQWSFNLNLNILIICQMTYSNPIQWVKPPTNYILTNILRISAIKKYSEVGIAKEKCGRSSMCSKLDLYFPFFFRITKVSIETICIIDQ